MEAILDKARAGQNAREQIAGLGLRAGIGMMSRR
jgi:hypothetical protein